MASMTRRGVCVPPGASRKIGVRPSGRCCSAGNWARSDDTSIMSLPRILRIRATSSFVPNPARWVGEPAVDGALGQVENQLPEANLFARQTASLAAHEEIAQRLVAESAAQPTERLPIADGQDATGDEVAVRLPGHDAEAALPEEL